MWPLTQGLNYRSACDVHAGFPCPNGWLRYLSNCYYMTTINRDWSGGRADCQAMNSDLLSISDQEEQDFVESYV